MDKKPQNLKTLLSSIHCFIRFCIEDCVDLKFWDIPRHPEDLAWYAERVNGRIAMLALTFILLFELNSHETIWKLFERF